MASKESYVIQSKLKALVRKSKMKCSADVIDALNKLVQAEVQKGLLRAKANGRKTLRGADL